MKINANLHTHLGAWQVQVSPYRNTMRGQTTVRMPMLKMNSIIIRMQVRKCQFDTIDSNINRQRSFFLPSGSPLLRSSSTTVLREEFSLSDWKLCSKGSSSSMQDFLYSSISTVLYFFNFFSLLISLILLMSYWLLVCQKVLRYISLMCLISSSLILPSLFICSQLMKMEF